jgi:hypothetical protein
MQFFMEQKYQLVAGIIMIPAGAVMLFTGGTGGIFIGVGILMIIVYFYHKSNPVLQLEDDHLVYNPALLRSKTFVKRKDVLGVEETEKGWFNTDIYRITTETEGELDIAKVAFSDETKATFVDDVRGWIAEEAVA